MGCKKGDSLVLATPPTPKGTSINVYDSCYVGSCTCTHYIGGILSQLKPCRFAVWLFGQGSIITDDDMTLFAGIVDGFNLVSSDVDPYECENYTSITDPPNDVLMSDILKKELEYGYVTKVDSKPICVHALGAVPKQGGGIRQITDCSRPQGMSINDHMEGLTKEFSMKGLDDVSHLLLYGDYLCVIDIHAAYRAVSINPEHRRFQGFKWISEGVSQYYVDNRMCFGLRCAPYYFNLISNFIHQIFTIGYGLKAVNYADDFIIMSHSFNQSLIDQGCAVAVLRYLGFSVAWGKLSPPSTVATYLGIEVDSINLELRLPIDKLLRLRALLESLKGEDKISRKNLQSLTGLLAHCATVVRGGRSFCRRLYDLDKLAAAQQLREVTLNTDAMLDITWWRDFVQVFNGRSTIKKNRCNGSIISDSSMRGFAAHFHDDWLCGTLDTSLPINTTCGHVVTPPALHHSDMSNINVLELYPVLCALKRWVEIFRGQSIDVISDNYQVVYMLRTGRSSNKQCMKWIRDIFWLSVTNDFEISTSYITSEDNLLADTLSRLAYPSTCHKLPTLIHGFDLCCKQALLDLSRASTDDYEPAHH